jgi:hypothetical protein
MIITLVRHKCYQQRKSLYDTNTKADQFVTPISFLWL